MKFTEEVITRTDYEVRVLGLDMYEKEIWIKHYSKSKCKMCGQEFKGMNCKYTSLAIAHPKNFVVCEHCAAEMIEYDKVKFSNNRGYRKTSKEWLEDLNQNSEFEVVVYDPDGWNRKDYDYSFNVELITEEEFTNRLTHSTVLRKI